MKRARHDLVKRLRARRLVGVIAFWSLLAVMLTVLVVAPWIAGRLEFERAKSDFAQTWCETYLSDPSDPATEEWLAYAERHRPLLEQNFDVLGLEDFVAYDSASASRNGIDPVFSGDALFLEARTYGYPRSRNTDWDWGFPEHFEFFGFPPEGPETCAS